MPKANLPEIIKKSYDEIVSIKIQGATNVAIKTFETIQEWALNYKENDFKTFWSSLEQYAWVLAQARPNEPLAKNGVKYLFTNFKIQYNDLKQVDQVSQKISEISKQYLQLLEDSKKKLLEKSDNLEQLQKIKVIFTHCHSSTSESLIKNIHSKNALKAVISTETRPLYQGRITSTNFNNAKIPTYMIVDSAGPYFIKNTDFLPVDIVFLGADEITVKGDTINKIGSFGLALSAYFASKPVYIVTPALKLDLSTIYNPPKIEMRDATEIWPEAPKGLNIINPAFDIIDHRFIQGFITEFGLIHTEYLEDKVRKEYEWLS